MFIVDFTPNLAESRAEGRVGELRDLLFGAEMPWDVGLGLRMCGRIGWFRAPVFGVGFAVTRLGLGLTGFRRKSSSSSSSGFVGVLLPVLLLWLCLLLHYYCGW